MERTLKTNNNFTAIRLLLACAVIVTHAFQLAEEDLSHDPLMRFFHSVTLGGLAVDCFFIMSGYLVTKSLLSSVDITNYFIKRIARIYPSFIVCGLVCAFLIGPVFGNNPEYIRQFHIFAFLRGLLVLQMDIVPNIWAGYPYAQINQAAWTIPWEFGCYVVIALLGTVGIARSTGKLFLVLVTVGILWAALICSGLTVGLFHDHLAMQLVRVVPRFLFMFLCGAIYLRLEASITRAPLALIAAILIIPAALLLGEWARLVVAIPLTLILMAVGKVQFPFTRAVAKLPDMSYGTYLYGWPVEKILTAYCGVTSPYLVIALAIPMAIFCGLVNRYMVERYFDNVRIKSIDLPVIRSLLQKKKAGK